MLDVGCGIGGTSRYLAKKFPSAEVTGITISPEQQRRATDLAAERGISNAKFELCDALDMKYPDNSFDFVWACESGEHMPDKVKYIEEMTRVLKPGASRARAVPARVVRAPEKPRTPRPLVCHQFLRLSSPSRDPASSRACVQVGGL